MPISHFLLNENMIIIAKCYDDLFLSQPVHPSINAFQLVISKGQDIRNVRGYSYQCQCNG